ncbi:MAG: two pore domain potassium channel family protein [Deltaproteobacteria bacterium]|nr:two pore domain potassium channel family protein [Deltaproteobacteria bacterium]
MELRWRAKGPAPRFLVLLTAMFVEILLAPLIYASPVGVAGARFVTGILLVAALATTGIRRTPVVLFVVVLGAHLLAGSRPETHLVVLASVLRMVFFGYVCQAVIVRVLRERNVTYDTLAGAACGYVLLGIVFGEMFFVNELLGPGSFEIPTRMVVASAHDLRPALLYFSFVTLTTIGYGDILPANPGVGGLAVLEAVIGQLYLTVTVARLVGLHLAGRNE